jgi:protein MAK11
MNSIPETKEDVAEITPVAEYDTNGTRLTCVTIADGDGETKPLNGKRRRDEDDVDHSDGEVMHDEVDSGDDEVEENEEESEED